MEMEIEDEVTKSMAEMRKAAIRSAKLNLYQILSYFNHDLFSELEKEVFLKLSEDPEVQEVAESFRI